MKFLALFKKMIANKDQNYKRRMMLIAMERGADTKHLLTLNNRIS